MNCQAQLPLNIFQYPVLHNASKHLLGLEVQTRHSVVEHLPGTQEAPESVHPEVGVGGLSLTLACKALQAHGFGHENRSKLETLSSSKLGKKQRSYTESADDEQIEEKDWQSIQ